MWNLSHLIVWDSLWQSDNLTLQFTHQTVYTLEKLMVHIWTSDFYNPVAQQIRLGNWIVKITGPNGFNLKFLSLIILFLSQWLSGKRCYLNTIVLGDTMACHKDSDLVIVREGWLRWCMSNINMIHRISETVSQNQKCPPMENRPTRLNLAVLRRYYFRWTRSKPCLTKLSITTDYTR